MPVQCCYTPQGRSFEEYLKYLQGEAQQFTVDENNIEFNFCVAQKMSENASSKAAVMPDEAYVHAMKGAHFLQRMLSMEDNQLQKYSLKHKGLEGKKAVRSVLMDCIAIAESIVPQEGGPLQKLYRVAFAEEESQQAMRSGLLEKQHMKGELGEDDRGYLTLKDDDKPIKQKEEKLLRMQAMLNGFQYVPPALVQPLPTPAEPAVAEIFAPARVTPMTQSPTLAPTVIAPKVSPSFPSPADEAKKRVDEQLRLLRLREEDE